MTWIGIHYLLIATSRRSMNKIVDNNKILVLKYNELVVINLKSGRSCEECSSFDYIRLGLPCELYDLIDINDKTYHRECSIVNLLEGSCDKVAKKVSKYNLSLFLVKYIRHEKIKINIS